MIKGVDMIHIKQSTEADSRTAKHKVTKEELLTNSHQHINDVGQAIDWMIERLLGVADQHDWTKIDYIDEFHNDFSATQDGFQGNFKQMHWFKDLHLQERHHLNDYCPDDVNLFDVLERIVDVTMAGLARSGSIYLEDIDPEMLVRAYNNTIALLASNTEVKESCV